jgi:hypothetical protein
MDDVKEAAERLRRLRGSESGAAVYEFVPIPLPAGGFMWPGEAMARHERDRALVERAYLALVPADSDEPITAEWLREMGFTIDDWLEGEWAADLETDGRNSVRIFWDGTACIDLCDTFFPCPTRGQLRQLLSALGIQPTSKETR